MAGSYMPTRRNNVKEDVEASFCEHVRIDCPFCGQLVLGGHDKGKSDLVFLHQMPFCSVFMECDNDEQYCSLVSLRVRESLGKQVLH